MQETDHVSMTQAAYDSVAEAYSELVGTELADVTEGPIDMALLKAFVQIVEPGRPVADLGCGPGRVAAFLAARGLETVGVDLSPEMVAVARNAHPGLRFEHGRLSALPFPDRSLGGAVCWYSIIHTPLLDLDPVWAQLARVLIPGGSVLLAFQAGGGEAAQRSEAYGTTVSLTSYRHDPDAVAGSLTDSGFHVHARVVREPEFAHESTPQAFILARFAEPGDHRRKVDASPR